MDEHAKVALFGANSTGKTLQIGHLIKAFGAANVGIISCEDGLKTIGSLVDPQHVKEVNSIEEFQQAYKWAEQNYFGLDKWVCVDGGTRVMQWIAGKIWAGTDACYTKICMGERRDELPNTLKPFLRFISNQGDIDGQRQWISIGRDIDWELNRWVKLPANMYWTFWEELTSIDQYKKGKPYQVDCPGKAGRDAVMGSFDFVLRLTKEGETVVATHDPTRNIVRSKTRDDWNGRIRVPESIPDFNLAEFVNVLLKPEPEKATVEATQ